MSPVALTSAILAGPPLAPLDEHVNVASFVETSALRAPSALAVVEDASGRAATFAELAGLVQRTAAGLEDLGLARGDRAAVFVKPSIELVALAFALFRIGAVPVLLDPGLGRDAVLAGLERTKPRAFVGTPLAHLLRHAYGGRLGSIEIDVVAGPRFAPFARTLHQITRAPKSRGDLAPTRRDDPAAILFTSGSTGPAKGVAYTHGTFAAQIAALRALYGFEPGEVDVACFPLFALFDVAFGMTAVVPQIDATRPGSCDPALVARALDRHRATTTFGSPAIWKRVAPWAASRGARFAGVRRVLIAGAPVQPRLVEALAPLLPDGDVATPFGATESLPVASIAGREILALRPKSEGGFGTCVGRAAPGIEIAVVAPRDGVIERWSDALALPRATVGELCVRGAVVTHGYDANEAATRASKIPSERGPWHRMGDLGWIDDEDRVWFCGRVAHALRTPDGLAGPVPVENVYNAHPKVARSALVATSEGPTLVIEPLDRGSMRSSSARDTLVNELEALRERAEIEAAPTARPRIARMLVHDAFPVDVRHNAKIDRPALAKWADRLVRPQARRLRP